MTEQTWNPDRYIKNAGFVATLGMPVVELLNPQPGERILDLGCGDGALTLKLVEMGCDVIGIDGSTEQIAAAQAHGLNATVMDGQALTFNHEFDAVFSNATLHWLKKADATIQGVWQALKPGGRFVAEFGGGDNVGQIRAALHTALRQRHVDPEQIDPWYFPSPEAYQAKLEAHGFTVSSIQLIPRPTPLPGDMISWLETFGEAFTNTLPAEARHDYLIEVQETLRPTLCDSAGNWTADYVRLRFAAFKPSE